MLFLEEKTIVKNPFFTSKELAAVVQAVPRPEDRERIVDLDCE